jgi:hypothetical protein
LSRPYNAWVDEWSDNWKREVEGTQDYRGPVFSDRTEEVPRHLFSSIREDRATIVLRAFNFPLPVIAPLIHPAWVTNPA